MVLVPHTTSPVALSHSVEEVVFFDQGDLNVDDCMVLDTGDEVYVWVGSGADADEKEKALALAEV